VFPKSGGTGKPVPYKTIERYLRNVLLSLWKKGWKKGCGACKRANSVIRKTRKKGEAEEKKSRCFG